jgi:hypothetical protein
MRLITAAGVLILSTGPALGAYLVELEGADRMTVDSYWVDGNQMHLMQGGVDLSVPRSRVRSVKETSAAVGSAEAPVRHPSAAPAPSVAASNGSETVQDLKAEQRRIEHHLLRVQQQRFEAKNRNDPPVKQKRLEKEFARTQHRRMGVIREIAER